jgi:hypothetical protein
MLPRCDIMDSNSGLELAPCVGDRQLGQVQVEKLNPSPGDPFVLGSRSKRQDTTLPTSSGATLDLELTPPPNYLSLVSRYMNMQPPLFTGSLLFISIS